MIAIGSSMMWTRKPEEPRPSARFRLLFLLFLALPVFVSGCANYAAPFQTPPARPGIESRAASDLRSLPAPADPVVVAVYRFRDQTGQYKAVENGSSFSTAVTQGATSILMRALEESGWFVPIEREGLSNLLNERQIIQSIRQQHKGAGGEDLGPLPPLLYAGVMLEGGIVGYDTNVLTGGAGARYFGIGGSGEYRKDQVTVYLRAVSTQSGRVLKTVHTTKTILSQKVDGGAFLFVDQDRLLETEAGYSFNEPPVLAVTEAIDQAVRGLILEGIRAEIWTAAPNQSTTVARALQAYTADTERSRQHDYFDRLRKTDPRPGLAVGIYGAGQRYDGDVRSPESRGGGGVVLRHSLSPHWAVGLDVDAGRIAAEQVFDIPTAGAALGVRYHALPFSPLTPYLEAGGGVRLIEPLTGRFGANREPEVGARAGLETLLGRKLGIDLSAGVRYALGDNLDGAEVGRYTDSIWSLRVGLTLYTGWLDGA
jgi:curli production assembly/transport component CsgG